MATNAASQRGPWPKQVLTQQCIPTSIMVAVVEKIYYHGGSCQKIYHHHGSCQKSFTVNAASLHHTQYIKNVGKKMSHNRQELAEQVFINQLIANNLHAPQKSPPNFAGCWQYFPFIHLCSQRSILCLKLFRDIAQNLQPFHADAASS